MVKNRPKNNSKFQFSSKTDLFLSENKKIISKINDLENEFKILNNNELQLEINKVKSIYDSLKHFDSDSVAKSFALTREASKRVLGLRHYDVQLMGGLVLNNCDIAEMKTGEGKTLVATLPAILNGLTQKGVHIVTVNDYLANRDHIGMGQLYQFLNVKSGLIQENMKEKLRQKNYQCDITYVTNYELAFDYLRDNITLSLKDIVLRNFNYCIIDEVDSILIDEAQTPLILSKINSNVKFEKYIIASEVASYLLINIHYQVDEKNRTIVLTELGNKRAEDLIQVNNLYDSKDPWIQYITNALKATSLFFKNIHYIIQNEKIIIVDEFTGRLMPDRKWGEGLHQAIEVKEKVPISAKTETQASITYQNFFLLYPKLSGMTGTAKTSQVEFENIYNLSVNVIPTFRSSKRLDSADLVYVDQFSKWNAIVNLCKKISTTGQPLLIGTTTVEKSEMLAQLLNEYKLSYQILNAKPENVRQESQIISQAGKRNSITISTNMAGRGTDIILGGNTNLKMERKLFNLLKIIQLKAKFLITSNQYNSRYIRYRLIRDSLITNAIKNMIGCSIKFYNLLLNLIIDSSFLSMSNIEILNALRTIDKFSKIKLLYQNTFRFLKNEIKFVNNKRQSQESEIVKNLGGLCVVGTERNNSRRIDNQLIGRCGRQGDPGSSYFFVSLDDNLLRLFGGDKIRSLLLNNTFGDSSINSNFINFNKILESAQQRVEEKAYEQRKNLFKYDLVLEKQRNIVYSERRLILNNLSNKKNIINYSEQICLDYLNQILNNKTNLNKEIKIFEHFIGKDLEIYDEKKFGSKWSNFTLNEKKNYLYQELWISYQLKIEEVAIYGNKISKNFERMAYLGNIDKIWQVELEKSILLRDAVMWRGYGQKNPLTEYRKESYISFCKEKELFVYMIMYSILRSTLV